MSKLSEREKTLEDCMTIIASAIDHHGNAFWPVYKLLDEELHSLRERKQKLKDSLSRIQTSDHKLKVDAVV